MKNKNEKRILLGLTTTYNSDLMKKVKEITPLGIEEIALFPTTIDRGERRELYDLLEKTTIKRIPFVHLRHDMGSEELDYLISRFHAKVFNIHPQAENPSPSYFLKYADRIYVENLKILPTAEEVRKYAGLCLDFSHWENIILMKGDEYSEGEDEIKKLINIFPIGCCHVSVIKKELHKDEYNPGILEYASHLMEDLSEFDYIKKYITYLPSIIGIELENSFAEQLAAKEYLEKIISNHG